MDLVRFWSSQYRDSTGTDRRTGEMLGQTQVKPPGFSRRVRQTERRENPPTRGFRVGLNMHNA